MTDVLDPRLVRRYLLGDASEEECSTIEQRFFADNDAAEQVATVEEELVESYLADRLDQDTRQKFDSRYLASERHRLRVAAIRRLTAAANRDSKRTLSRTFTAPARWLAAAATVTLAAGGWWLVRSRTVLKSPPSTSAAQSTAGPPPASPAPLRVFAFSVPPDGVRGPGGRRSLIIPAGVDVVALDLEAEGAVPRPISARATIRTLDGRDIWGGPASVASELPDGVVARIEVPARRLLPEDYMITLLATGTKSADREVNTYFLRVRRQ